MPTEEEEEEEELKLVAPKLATNEVIKQSLPLVRFLGEVLVCEDALNAYGNESAKDLLCRIEGIDEALKFYRVEVLKDTVDTTTTPVPSDEETRLRAVSVAACCKHRYGTDFEVTTLLRAIDDYIKWARGVQARATRPGFIMPNPTSAQNLEVGGMAIAYLSAEGTLRMPEVLAYLISSGVVSTAAEASDITKARNWLDNFPSEVMGLPAGTSGEELRNHLTEFLDTWCASGFARVELPETLCASLCLTDTGNVDVQAPWEAWSIVLPPGLFPGVLETYVARIWCLGMEVVGIVASDGDGLRLEKDDPASDAELHKMFVNLARGAALVISDPNRVKKRSRQARPSGSSRTKERAHNPVLKYTSFQLSSPIKLTGEHDVRHVVRNICKGTLRGGPKSQWLVRGHHRNQSHGKGRLQHKRIWIAPHWKGDPEARILLRTHKVEE